MKKIFGFFLFILISTQAFANSSNWFSSFSHHNENYATLGDTKDQLKGQIGFKYKVIEDIDFYVGYTQVIIWSVYNTKQSTSPRDINYNPELFYRKDFFWLMHTQLNLIPFEHKSNGRADQNEREYNLVGASIINTINFKNFDLFFGMKFYKLFGVGDDNYDIGNYIGLGQHTIGVKTKFLLREELGIGFLIGTSGYVTKTYNLSISLTKQYGLYFQIYDGYCETLIAYAVKDTHYRAGITFR